MRAHFCLARRKSFRIAGVVPALGSESEILAARRESLMLPVSIAAVTHEVSISWLLAFARKETNFQNLRSPPGARDDILGGAWGPMQITSATASDLGICKRLSLRARGEWLLADPARGIDAGAQFVARLKDRFGKLGLVAAAYNAGAGRVAEGRVPRSTREEYVPFVLKFQREYAIFDLTDPKAVA